MDLLAFGKTGWGDELFYATLMTIAVSLTAMLIGFLFALIFTPLKLSKNKFLNLIGNSYTTVIRGVPELLVIYLFFDSLSGVNIKAKRKPINIAVIETAIVIRVAINNSSPQPVFPNARISIQTGDYIL